MVTHGACEECARAVLEDYRKQGQAPALEPFLIATREERATGIGKLPPVVSVPDPRVPA